MSSRGRQALGLALFLRRGMAAWMQAWSKCLDCVTPPAPPQPATTPVPMDVRGQVARLLAGIILGLHQEGNHMTGTAHEKVRAEHLVKISHGPLAGTFTRRACSI